MNPQLKFGEDISMNITLPHALHQHFNLRSLSECGKRFQERGGLSKFQGQHRKGTGLPGTNEANASIIRHFDFHPKDSITKAAADLGLSRTHNLESRESCQNEALQSAQNTPN